MSSTRLVRVGASSYRAAAAGGVPATEDVNELSQYLQRLDGQLQQERDARMTLEAKLEQAFAKLGDQDAGLHTLMDLLEDTMSRTDFQAIAEQTARDTEEQLQSVAESLNAAIQQQAAGFDELFSTVQNEAAHAAGTTDEQLRTLRLELEAVRQSATELARDSSAKLTGDLKDLERSCDRRMVDVERRVSHVVRSAETWGERVQTQGIVTDQVTASISALESKTESAILLLHKETDHQVRQCRDLSGEQVASLEARFTTSTKQLHDSQAAQAAAFSTDLQTTVESLETQLRRCQTQLDATNGVLQLAETLETRLENKLGDSSASLEQRLGIATAKVDHAVSEMTERSVVHTAELESLRAQLKNTKVQADDATAALDDRMEELKQQTGSQMNDKLHDFHTRYKAQLSKLESQLGLDKRELSSSVHKLTDSLEQTDKECQERVTKLRETLTEQTRKEAIANQEKNAAQDAAIAGQHAQLDKVAKALGMRIDDRAGVVDARLAEITSIVHANHASATALCARAESKTSDTSQHLERSLEGTRAAVDASLKAMESKYTDVSQHVDLRVKDQMSAFSAKLQDTANGFSDRCASIDRRFTQWGQDFSDQHRHALAQCENRIESASQRLESCESTITKLVGDCATNRKTTEATSSHVAKQFTELDKRIRESHQTLDAGTQHARAAAESKLGVLSDGLNAIETAQRSVTHKLDSAQTSIAETQAQMQQMRQRLEDSVHETHQSGQKSLDSLRSEVSAQRAAHDQKLHAAEEHWQSVAARLDQQIVDANVSVDGKLRDLKDSFNESVQAIAAQSREADLHHDAQIKEVEKSLAQNGLEDQQRCQQLEESMMDKDKQVKDQLHDLGLQLNARMAENKKEMLKVHRSTTEELLEYKQEATELRQAFVHEVTTRTKAVTVSLERAQAANAERHDDLQRELASSVATITEDASRSSASLSGRLAELEDQLQSSSERLSDRCQELEKSSAAERAAIDRKHSTRSTALLDRLNDTRKIATEAQSSATSGHKKIDEHMQVCDARFKATQKDTEAKFAAAEETIKQLGEDVTENLKAQVDQLQKAVDSDFEPLKATVNDMGEKLAKVGEQAATADGTRVKLDLLIIDVEEVKTAVKTLDEQEPPTGEDFAGMKVEVDAVKEDVQDLGVELSIVASTIDAVQ